jgi:hypothetical protein
MIVTYMDINTFENYIVHGKHSTGLNDTCSKSILANGGVLSTLLSNMGHLDLPELLRVTCSLDSSDGVE